MCLGTISQFNICFVHSFGMLNFRTDGQIFCCQGKKHTAVLGEKNLISEYITKYYIPYKLQKWLYFLLEIFFKP